MKHVLAKWLIRVSQPRESIYTVLARMEHDYRNLLQLWRYTMKSIAEFKADFLAFVASNSAADATIIKAVQEMQATIDTLSVGASIDDETTAGLDALKAQTQGVLDALAAKTPAPPAPEPAPEPAPVE